MKYAIVIAALVVSIQSVGVVEAKVKAVNAKSPVNLLLVNGAVPLLIHLKRLLGCVSHLPNGDLDTRCGRNW